MTAILFGIAGAFALVVAVFFASFWRSTRDRFFCLFSAAFAVLAVHWLVLAMVDVREHTPHHYLIRLLAFALIVGAIVDKNRE